MQTSFYSLLLVEFSSQLSEPFVGTFDLFSWLEFACGDISLSPLGETFGDLLDTTDWVVFVVSWESTSVFVEFLNPVGSSLIAQVSVAPFSSKLVQFVQTLERVSWWDLLILSRCNSNDGSDGEFHFVYLNPYRSFDPH